MFVRGGQIISAGSAGFSRDCRMHGNLLIEVWMYGGFRARCGSEDAWEIWFSIVCRRSRPRVDLRRDCRPDDEMEKVVDSVSEFP